MRRTRVVVIACAALAVAVLALAGSALQFGLTVGEALAQSSVRPPENAVNVAPSPEIDLPGGSVRPPPDAMVPIPTEPGMPRQGTFNQVGTAEGVPGALGPVGPNSDADFWSYLRSGNAGSVSIPDERAAVLVQDSGMWWLEWRAKGGPLQTWGAWAMLGMLVLLALFYLLRGRIRLQRGWSGIDIVRFRGYERFAHWLAAVSFVLLGITGLNLLYGKDYVLPVIGKEAFATVTVAGKWLHDNAAWGFMAALIMMFVFWVAHNIPGRADLIWIAKGGGFFTKGAHPPAPKFNAGEKLIFWAVMLCGVSLALSGISLLFPYQLPLFDKTFAALNSTGLPGMLLGGPLPTGLSGVQEMQYAQIWHAMVGLAMITIIFAHIYIGTLGMEGAFSAMGTGRVDRNWAQEHHSLWMDDGEARHRGGDGRGATTPAE